MRGLGFGVLGFAGFCFGFRRFRVADKARLSQTAIKRLGEGEPIPIAAAAIVYA